MSNLFNMQGTLFYEAPAVVLLQTQQGHVLGGLSTAELVLRMPLVPSLFFGHGVTHVLFEIEMKVRFRFRQIFKDMADLSLLTVSCRTMPEVCFEQVAMPF